MPKCPTCGSVDVTDRRFKTFIEYICRKCGRRWKA